MTEITDIDRARAEGATPLSDLIARVEGGEGGDRELSAEVLRLFGDGVADRGKLGWTWRANNVGIWHNLPDLTTDLNAVIALCERVLPGFDFRFERDEGVHKAGVWKSGTYIGGYGCHGAPTPARALLAAMLRAKEAGHG